MNKTLEGLKNLETCFEKSNMNIYLEKNKIFITKKSRRSSTAVFSDNSSQRYLDIQSIDKGAPRLRETVSNDKYGESVNSDQVVIKNIETIDHNKKIKDLKRQIFRQKSAMVNSLSSRNLKKDFNGPIVAPYKKIDRPSQKNSLFTEEERFINRPKSSGIKRKLTFSRNQSIPILINPPKKQSNKSILSLFLQKTSQSKRAVMKESLDKQLDRQTSTELLSTARKRSFPTKNSYLEM
jgi:hypothetical protein